MRKILLSLFIFISIHSFAQNDTTKYFNSVDYGWRYQRVKARLGLTLPTDTVANKLVGSVVLLNDVFYIKTTSAWSALGGVTLTSFSGGTGISYNNTTGVITNSLPMVYPSAGIALSTGSAWGASITDNSANWNTAYTNRISSLTTTGSSGASTLLSNVLNIPNYTLAGLGGIGLTNLSVTNTGSSGAATYNNTTGVFNIPNYTLAGLGGIGLTSLSATSPIFYNNTTGVISSQAATSSLNGYLTSTDWTNFNTAYTGRIQNGLLSARPTAGTSGRYYFATDNSTTYFDNGTAWVIMEPAMTGDVTSSAGGVATTLATVNSNVGSFGTSTSVPSFTVNAKGLITAASATAIPTANTTTLGLLSAADWNTFNGKQGAITLTTTGTSGAATFATNTLNIPNYTYTLPTATNTVLGGVKPDGTSILNAAGVISATAASIGAQPLATNLTSIGGLANAAGVLRNNGTGTFSYDNTVLTANQTITLSGAVTGSGSTAITTTLANGVVGVANHSATGTPSATTFLRGDNTWSTPAGGGTVTSASVVSANGFSGTVATATSTPAITLTTTVSGMVKGATSALVAATAGTDYSAGTAALATGILKSTTTTGALSIAAAGTDYQAPLTGTGFVKSTAGTISYDNSTYQPLATNLTSIGALANAAGVLVNNGTGTFSYSTTPTLTGTNFSGVPYSALTGTPTITNTVSFGSTGLTPSTATSGAITVAGTLVTGNGGTGVTSVTTTPTATAFAGWDANKNLSANNLLEGWTSTATAGGTTTLTVASTQQQLFTGTTTQTVVLPVVTTLVNGFTFYIINQSTGSVTVQTSGAVTLVTLSANTMAECTVVNTAGGTGTASWLYDYASINTTGGGGGVTTFSAGTTGLTPSTATSGAITLAGTLAAANGGTGQSTYAIGDLLSANTTSTLSKIADVAAGQPLLSGGVSTLPAYAGYTFSGTAAQTYTFPSASKTLAANDGSNLTIASQAIGDILVASSTTAYGRLADAATGNALISGGAGVAPSYGKIGLTTHVTGTLPIANGGTNVTAVTTAPTATAFAGWDANKNLSANNHIEGYTTTATAAGTTTLTVASTYQQFFTGTTTQTVVLPVATTLVNGFQFIITNNSTGVVTVQTSGAVTVVAMAANTSLNLTCVNTAGGTGTASWGWSYATQNNTTIGGGGTTTNALTMNNSGTGAASGTTFNGSAAQTISYNTIGASPLAGSASLTTVGTIGTGTWNATAIANTVGGTGLNTSASTGVPSIATGTWSVNAQLPVSLGGTGAATLTGLVKGNGTSAFTVAVAGTDYMTPSNVSASYVPYTGATGAVNLGTNTLASGAITSSGVVNMSSSSTTGVLEGFRITNSAATTNGSGGSISFVTSNASFGSSRNGYISVTNPSATGSNYGVMNFFVANATSDATLNALSIYNTGAATFSSSVTAAQYASTVQTLTDGATITFNAANGSNAVVTLGGNRTLAWSNTVAGTYYTLRVIQDATGSRTLALPTGSKVIGNGGGVITLSTAANAVDLITFYYDGTNYYVTYGTNYN